VGELHVTGADKQGLPGGGSTRSVSAPQLVGHETSGPEFGPFTLLRPLPRRGVWITHPDRAQVQPPDCESLILIRKPDAANPQVRLEEREVETEQGLRYFVTKGKPRSTEIPQPKPPRHFSTPLHALGLLYAIFILNTCWRNGWPIYPQLWPQFSQFGYPLTCDPVCIHS
jgi:hypothetical protein